MSNHQISLWAIPLPSVYSYSLPISVAWAAKTIGSLEERRMGSRRRFVEQFCHAALLGTTDVVSFHHEPGALICDFELRIRAAFSFDFAKAARNPS